MAEFIDNEREDEVPLNEGEELASFDEPQGETPQQEEQVLESIEEPQDDIPEKYRGKDVKEIIRMHQEAEKLFGRQSQEVGELRRTVDNFIQSQLVNKNTNESPTLDVDEDDFYTDPKSAISKAIDSHPAVLAAKESRIKLQQQEAIATLKAKHPDFEQLISDAEFVDWVQKSKVRQQLLVSAHRDFNVDAADELFSTFKERKEMVSKAVGANRQANKQAIKQAAVGSGTGSAEPRSRKIYRRSDIVNLMETNPRRYEALQDEIMRAYEEGRVR